MHLGRVTGRMVLLPILRALQHPDLLFWTTLLVMLSVAVVAWPSSRESRDGRPRIQPDEFRFFLVFLMHQGASFVLDIGECVCDEGWRWYDAVQQCFTWIATQDDFGCVWSQTLYQITSFNEWYRLIATLGNSEKRLSTRRQSQHVCRMRRRRIRLTDESFAIASPPSNTPLAASSQAPGVPSPGVLRTGTCPDKVAILAPTKSVQERSTSGSTIQPRPWRRRVHAVTVDDHTPTKDEHATTATQTFAAFSPYCPTPHSRLFQMNRARLDNLFRFPRRTTATFTANRSRHPLDHYTADLSELASTVDGSLPFFSESTTRSLAPPNHRSQPRPPKRYPLKSDAEQDLVEGDTSSSTECFDTPEQGGDAVREHLPPAPLEKLDHGSKQSFLVESGTSVEVVFDMDECPDFCDGRSFKNSRFPKPQDAPSQSAAKGWIHDYLALYREDGDEILFWTSRLAKLCYAIALVATLSRQYWLLRGVLLLLSWQLLRVSLPWLVFIVDCPQVWNFAMVIRTIWRRARKEGSKLLSGDNSRVILAGTILSTGTNSGTWDYVRAILRYQSSSCNNKLISLLKQERATIERRWNSFRRNSSAGLDME
jgi:N6-adenosine-specific RNA methylase IME4